MRLAALLERTPSGWRGWVPAIPGLEVEGPTSAAVEEDLARALERHLRERWAAGTFEAPPDLRCFNVEIRLRPRYDERRPLERQGEEEKRRTLRRLDAVLADGARLPSGLLNAVFEYRREVRDALPDELEEEPSSPAGPTPNVVTFMPRKG